MAKAPRAGSVKTRLAGQLSLGAVTELYRCLLIDTIALAQSLVGVEVLLMCPESDVEELFLAVEGAAPVVPQSGKGLAAALTSVFALFARSAGKRVIAFNSDSPHLPTSLLERAFGVLETRDLVIGPTYDGGYYLVGAKTSHPELFTSDGMGTGSALSMLLSRAKRLSLSVALTERFYDVDVAEDLGELAEELQRTPGKAPRTAKWLLDWASLSRQSETG
jgi:rSAM/selenodomain-associated transferase 1